MLVADVVAQQAGVYQGDNSNHREQHERHRRGLAHLEKLEGVEVDQDDDRAGAVQRAAGVYIDGDAGTHDDEDLDEHLNVPMR